MQICVDSVKYGANLRKARKIRCKCAPDKVSSLFGGRNLRSPTLFGDEIYEPFMNWPRILRALRFFSPGLLHAVRAFASYLTRFTLICCVFHELFMDLPRTLWAWRGFAAYCATWGRSETSNLTPTLGKPQNIPKWASLGHSAEWFWRPSETRLANVNYETFLRIRKLFA